MSVGCRGGPLAQLKFFFAAPKTQVKRLAVDGVRQSKHGTAVYAQETATIGKSPPTLAGGPSDLLTALAPPSPGIFCLHGGLSNGLADDATAMWFVRCWVSPCYFPGRCPSSQ
jgi:hypothetical protein